MGCAAGSTPAASTNPRPSEVGPDEAKTGLQSPHPIQVQRLADSIAGRCTGPGRGTCSRSGFKTPAGVARTFGALPGEDRPTAGPGTMAGRPAAEGLGCVPAPMRCGIAVVAAPCPGPPRSVSGLRQGFEPLLGTADERIGSLLVDPAHPGSDGGRRQEKGSYDLPSRDSKFRLSSHGKGCKIISPARRDRTLREFTHPCLGALSAVSSQPTESPRPEREISGALPAD